MIIKELEILKTKKYKIQESNNSNKYQFVLFIAIIVLFLPTLVFPLSSDLSIFMMMGDYILEGKTIYQDFVDIKPPFLYYVFAFSNYILGNTEISIRLFIILYQLATVYFLYKSINLIYNNIQLSSLISIFFSIYFVSLGFDFSILPETLLFLPYSIILYLLIKNPLKYSSLIISGILIGLTTGLKYTLGILLVAYIISIGYELRNQKSKNKSIVIYFIILVSFSIGLFISLISLLDSNILNNYLTTFQYLNLYTNETPINLDFLILIIQRFFENILKKISILYFVLAILGLPIVISKLSKTKQFSKIYIENKLKPSIFIFSILSFILLSISVIVERKLTLLHFVRITIPLFLLIANAIYVFYNSEYIKQKLSSKISLVIISIIFIIGSPFPRYVKQLYINYGYYFDKNIYYSQYQVPSNPLLQQKDYQLVSDFIKNSFKDSKVIVCGIGVNVINYNLYRANNNYELTSFSQSCFYISKNEIEEYKTKFSSEIKDAEILILDNRDNHRDINYHKLTTFEMVQKRFFIEFSQYKLLKEIGQFKIYLRKT